MLATSQLKSCTVHMLGYHAYARLGYNNKGRKNQKCGFRSEGVDLCTKTSKHCRLLHTSPLHHTLCAHHINVANCP